MSEIVANGDTCVPLLHSITLRLNAVCSSMMTRTMSTATPQRLNLIRTVASGARILCLIHEGTIRHVLAAVGTQLKARGNKRSGVRAAHSGSQLKTHARVLSFVFVWSAAGWSKIAIRVPVIMGKSCVL